MINIEIAERDELFKKKKEQEEQFEREKAEIERNAEEVIDEIKGKSEIELKKIEEQLQAAEGIYTLFCSLLFKSLRLHEAMILKPRPKNLRKRDKN